ncbi:MAG: JAB domain-containing protein [Polyangiales bacterium]
MSTDIPIDPELPSARLRTVAVDLMSDTEVLALLLGDDASLARSLLSAHDGVRGVARLGRGELARDVGDRRAARLVAAMELARRAAARPLARAIPFRSSRDVVRAWGPRLVDAADERVLAVLLDAKRRPVAERLLAWGSVGSAPLAPRQVFALAVREGASAIVLVHNHPSGDPAPSPEDIAFTRRVAHAGGLLEVELLDHVIVGREGSFSFLDAGMITPGAGGS